MPVFDPKRIQFLEQAWQQQKAQQAAMNQPQPTRGRGGTLTSLISEGGAVGGAAGGAAIGSVVPGIGTVIGGLLGAGIGAFGGRLAENKVRDDRFGLADAAKEGALSTVLAGPLRLGKYAFGANKALRGGSNLSDALIQGAEKAAAPGLIRRTLSKGAERTSQRAANKFVEITPSAMQRLQDEGLDPQILLSKWGKQLGKDYDEMIKGSGRLIKEAEDSISKTAGVTGRNIRIDGSGIIKQLSAEAKKIRGELGGGQRLKQIEAIIADAKRKYAKGITVQQARNILREANQRFGASVLDDTGDAVARAAQKLEANVLRDALKSRFPTIEKALNDQSELIQLRELLKRGKAVNASKKGSNLGRMDLTRPGTFVDTVLNDPKITARLASRGGETVPGMTRTALGGAMTGARGATTASLAEALMGQPGAYESNINPSTMATSSPSPNTMSSASTMPGLSQSDANMSTSPFAPENLESAIQQIVANGGTLDDVSKFVGIATAVQKMSTMGQGQVKKTEAQRARDEAAALTDDALSQLQGGSVVTGPIGARVEDVKSIFNRGDPETIDFNTTVSALKAAIAKARAGTSFTPNEEKLLDQYAPKSGDSMQQLMTKLQNLQVVYRMAAEREYGTQYQEAPDDLANALLSAQNAY